MRWENVSSMEEAPQFASLAGSCHFTVRELCWQFGGSRKTGHHWLAYHAQGGMKAQPGTEVGDLPFDLETKELWLVFRRYGGETGRNAWISFQR